MMFQEQMEVTLKTARQNKGYTQTEAARKIGISPGTLSSYENGYTFPSVEIIKKIEDVYGLPYSQIRFVK